MKKEKQKICIVGLGYVGLPLAVAFGKKQEILAFDINKQRIKELKNNTDNTNEVIKKDLIKSNVIFSSNPKIIQKADFVIIAVPTPIDKDNKPDLKPLLSASKTVGENLNKNSIVVYESTVYPGCTERDCIPVLEKYSNLKFKKDFHIGYSPERINPGDRIHTVDKIVKVVSGSNKKTLNIIADTYNTIIKAGTHKAPTIKVAEAAKIIENTQRDVNIALMNELKMIFDKADIDWEDVLKAAGTKWNFLKFTPGLVGGHCIGVDPYYLAEEAERLGHYPEIILAGRNINDKMAKYEVKRIIKYIKENKLNINKILILGGTFKPNVPDTRNSKIEDLIKELKKHKYKVDIYEPFIKTKTLFNCKNINKKDIKNYNFIIKTVNHKVFKNFKYDYEILKYTK